MTFKPGAFLPGKPVQPILLRYPNQVDTVTWTWNQPHGARSVLWLTLTQPFSRASLEFLPVYHPSPEEIAGTYLNNKYITQQRARQIKISPGKKTREIK